MAEKIDLILADPNPLILSGMGEHIAKDGRFSLITTVAKTESFITTVMRVDCDVAIVCWNLPDMGGERILEILRDLPNPPRVVIYSQSTSPDIPRRAMAAGAAGYCAKESAVEDLMEICVDVAAGKMVFPFMDIRQLQSDPLHVLTKREHGLLQALAEGMTNADLAKHFDISINTVKFHLSNLYEKLGIRSRSKAIAFYYSRHLDKVSEPDGGHQLRKRGEN
ncbi:MAG: response regulator transcription factor [Pseudomonadota bacterium]